MTDKLTPREPTQAMMRAGYETAAFPRDPEICAAMWRAMWDEHTEASMPPQPTSGPSQEGTGGSDATPAAPSGEDAERARIVAFLRDVYGKATHGSSDLMDRAITAVEQNDMTEPQRIATPWAPQPRLPEPPPPPTENEILRARLAQFDALHRAAVELLRLKDLKMTIAAGGSDEQMTEWSGDYMRSKPNAWTNLRAALDALGEPR